jgi:hypothetical protein
MGLEPATDSMASVAAAPFFTAPPCRGRFDAFGFLVFVCSGVDMAGSWE